MTAYERRPRDTMPRLAEIALAWEALGSEDVRRLFPRLECFSIGWGEPFCFRCGWLSPTPDAAAFPGDLTPERRLKRTWNLASGWLERAHLQDHRFGGPEEPLNLVPLCPLCHDRQPESRTREEGIAFVNEGGELSPLVASWTQFCTDAWYRDRRRPGKAGALRCLLTARSFVATEFLKAQEACGVEFFS